MSADAPSAAVEGAVRRRSRQAIAIVSGTSARDRLAVLGAAYVGVLSGERGSLSGRV